MNILVKSLSFLVQMLLVLCFTVSSGEAKNWTLQDPAGNIATVDDETSEFTGLNSFIVNGVERAWQQWFWYRVGPVGGETSLDKLPQKVATIQPTLSSLLITYTLANQFDISVRYELMPTLFGFGVSLKKSVTIKNIDATALDFHLFEYSDFDLSDTGPAPGDNDNIEVFNNKVYQNGLQKVGGVTLVHETTLPPSKFDIDNNQIYILPEMEDAAPTDLFSPQTPYRYGEDLQFGQQWDLTIPFGKPVNFSITDSFYPTLPVAASKTHAETCVTYAVQADYPIDYTIGFDNLTNSEGLTNLEIIDFLPGNTKPVTSPLNGGVYDDKANTVIWSLPTLAAGPAQNKEKLLITVNSSTEITNELLLVSDQAFPTRITNTVALCNYPPVMDAIANASIDEGGAFSLQVVASDPDNNSLTYSLGGAPAGMTISATGLINYPAAVAGSYTITVTATDSGAGSLSVSKTFILTVVKSNTPPVITGTPPTRSKGDLDGNGKEDVADALLALQFAVGLKNPTATDMAFGDVAPFVNGKSAPDGKIDIADALAFLRKTVGLLNW